MYAKKKQKRPDKRHLRSETNRQPSGGKQRSDKKLRRREDLLSAAQTVFAEKGFHKTGVAEIVQRAGVAHGTFYLYFKSKRHVFEVLIDRLATDFYHTFSEFPIAQVRTQQEYVEAQRTLAARAIKLMASRRELAKILFWESVGLDQKFNRRVIEMQNSFIALSAAFIGHGIDIGIVRDDVDQVSSATFVVGGLWNLAFRWALEGTSVQRVSREIARVLDDHFHGILK